ncbi:MAG TPA: hypothetical protein ENG74_01020 [Thermoplasmatales archaeon]|nr:hypothetical protein [Thermoplasmatales archaeon]
MIAKLGIDTSDYGKKEWSSTYLMYLFTWMTVLIVLINPPFYDGEPPLVDMVILPSIQEPGGDVIIAAKIADNAGISYVNLSITDPSGSVFFPPYVRNGSIYSWTFESNTLGRFNVTLRAKDINGKERVVSKSFWYSNDAIRLVYPENGSKINHATPIRFVINESVSKDFIAYYLINGTKINLTKSQHMYETSPIYEGWEPRENVSLRVIIELRHCFNMQCFNNTVVDSSTYMFTTDDDSSIGVQPGPKGEGKLPVPTSPRVTPGFEVVALLTALLMSLIIWRKRLHERDK